MEFKIGDRVRSSSTLSRKPQTVIGVHGGLLWVKYADSDLTTVVRAEVCTPHVREFQVGDRVITNFRVTGVIKSEAINIDGEKYRIVFLDSGYGRVPLESSLRLES